MWTAVGGLLVATENIPAWGSWVALTLLVIAMTAWLAGAAIYHRDACKLLKEVKATDPPNHDRIDDRTRQADWLSA